MSDELKKLLQKYENEQLSASERNKLVQMAATKEGKEFILSSPQPEAVFLAPEDSPLPEWQLREEELEAAICRHQQYDPFKNFFTSKKFLALAATILIAVTISLPAVFNSPAEVTPESGKFIYVLKHRKPQEILPHIRNFMSEKTGFFVNNEKGTIEITDDQDTLASLERIIKLLDRQPLKLELNLKLLAPLSPETGVIRQAGAMPSEELDLDEYQLLNQLSFSALEGNQFKQIIQGRFDITCYITINPEATEATIVTLTIYDLKNKELIYRGRDIPLSKGWTRVEEGSKSNQNNFDTVVAVSLSNINQE